MQNNPIYQILLNKIPWHKDHAMDYPIPSPGDIVPEEYTYRTIYIFTRQELENSIFSIPHTAFDKIIFIKETINGWNAQNLRRCYASCDPFGRDYILEVWAEFRNVFRV